MTISFKKPDVEQFFQTYNITHFTVNKNETQLVLNSNLNGKFNLWAMDLPGNFPYPITYHNENSDFVKFDPEDRFLLTGMDHDGDENFQIYALPTEGGKPLPVRTGEANEKYYFSDLSEDGNRLYYMTSRDNPTYLDARCYHFEDGKDELLIKGQESPIFFERR